LPGSGFNLVVFKIPDGCSGRPWKLTCLARGGAANPGYDQLPESEKEYDRKTVVEALKAIIALGYEVTEDH
jgi:RyR domain